MKKSKGWKGPDFDAFQDFVKRILKVPKAEVDAIEAKRAKRKPKNSSLDQSAPIQHDSSKDP